MDREKHMPNRNININTSDPDDNPRLSIKKTSMRTVELVVIIISGSVAYLVVWFMSIAITNFYCWSKQTYVCIASDIVHTVFILGIIAAFVALGFYIVQVIANAKYLYQRGIYLDRDSIAAHAQDLIGVIRVSAQSEATYGLDTYSPSSDDPRVKIPAQSVQANTRPTNTPTNTPPVTPPVTPTSVRKDSISDDALLDGLLVTGSVIDDILNKKK
jgi:hypothetical protein